MTALVAVEGERPISHQRKHKGCVENAYSEELRAWCLKQPETLSVRTIAALCRSEFPSPWPDFSTVARWRDQQRRELQRQRSEVWEREWAERAALLVPASIVSLDRARQEAYELMERCVRRAAVADAKIGKIEAEGDHAPGRLHGERDAAESRMLQAVREVRDTSSQILAFCGATRNEPTLDPTALREQAIGQLVASGHASTREQAEALFDGLATAAGAPALGAGEAE